MADKFTRALGELVGRDYRSKSQISREAGVSSQCVHRWLTLRRIPNIHNYEAVLNTLGYELAIRRKQQ